MAHSVEHEGKKKSVQKDLWVIPVAVLLIALTLFLSFFMKSNESDEPDEQSSTGDITVVQAAGGPTLEATHLA